MELFPVQTYGGGYIPGRDTYGTLPIPKHNAKQKNSYVSKLMTDWKTRL